MIVAEVVSLRFNVDEDKHTIKQAKDAQRFEFDKPKDGTIKRVVANGVYEAKEALAKELIFYLKSCVCDPSDFEFRIRCGEVNNGLFYNSLMMQSSWEKLGNFK